jgi:hypothetical protein
MGMGTGMKETDKYTDSRRLSKESLDSAIRHLQKVIRKGAASNEYMHESVSFQRARDRRAIY